MRSTECRFSKFKSVIDSITVSNNVLCLCKLKHFM